MSVSTVLFLTVYQIHNIFMFTADENFTISCGKTGLNLSTVITSTLFTTMSDSQNSSASDMLTTEGNFPSITTTTNNKLGNMSTSVEITSSTFSTAKNVS